MRMNLLRRALVLALCAALVVGVAAQGAGAEGVDLWLVTEETTENGMNGAVRAQIDAFCQAHPEVSIRMDILPNKEAERAEYLQELRQKIESGAGPDLYLLPTGTVGSVRALWANAQQSGKLPDLLPADSDVPLVEMEPDVVRFPVETGIAALEAQLNDAKNGNAPTDADLTALAEAFLKSYTE